MNNARCCGLSRWHIGAPTALEPHKGSVATRQRLSDAPADQRAASHQVNSMIAAAINADAKWFWRGPDV